MTDRPAAKTAEKMLVFSTDLAEDSNYFGRRTRRVELYCLSTLAEFRLRSRPPAAEMTGQEMEEMVARLGGFRHDGINPAGNIVPAVRAVDFETGRQAYIAHARTGAPKDPAPGVFGMQVFDPESCRLARAESSELKASSADLARFVETGSFRPEGWKGAFYAASRRGIVTSNPFDDPESLPAPFDRMIARGLKPA